MQAYWLLWIAFLGCAGSVPKVIKRFRKDRELSDLLEIIGTAALGVAVIFSTIEVVTR